MTTPIEHGYPDFGRYSAQAAKLYDSGSSTSESLDLLVGSFFVGDTPNIGASLESATQLHRWQFRFYMESTLTTLVGEYDIDTNFSGRFNGSLPVIGPWVELRRLLDAAGPNTATWTIYQASALFHSDMDGANANMLISTSNNAIAAGTTEQGTTLATWPGEAFLHATSNATAWDVTLYSRNYALTDRFLMKVDNASPKTPHRLILPPTPIHYEVRNLDGVARAYDLTLVSRPMYPGV